jgi:hypothetical protein
MNIAFEKRRPCGARQASKQVRALHQAKNIMTTKRPLEMLYVDLFGHIAYISIGGNKYGLVTIDDYSRFTWVFFLQDKGETREVLKKFLKRAQNEFDAKSRGLEVIMAQSSRTLNLKTILMKKASSMSFWPSTLHNKMGWLKERIELS